MLLLVRASRRILVLLALAAMLSAPVAAQEASRVDPAGWVQSAWVWLTAPLESLWNDGRGGCDPDGGPCGGTQGSEPLPEGRGACDPNGGECEPGS